MMRNCFVNVTQTVCVIIILFLIQALSSSKVFSATVDIDFGTTTTKNFIGLGWNVHPYMFHRGGKDGETSASAWTKITANLDDANMQFARVLLRMEWFRYPGVPGAQGNVNDQLAKTYYYDRLPIQYIEPSRMDQLYRYLSYCGSSGTEVLLHNWNSGGGVGTPDTRGDNLKFTKWTGSLPTGWEATGGGTVERADNVLSSNTLSAMKWTPKNVNAEVFTTATIKMEKNRSQKKLYVSFRARASSSYGSFKLKIMAGNQELFTSNTSFTTYESKHEYKNIPIDALTSGVDAEGIPNSLWSVENAGNKKLNVKISIINQSADPNRYIYIGDLHVFSTAYFWLSRCCKMDGYNDQQKWWASGDTGVQTDFPHSADMFCLSLKMLLSEIAVAKNFKSVKYLGLWNEPSTEKALKGRVMSGDSTAKVYPDSFFELYSTMKDYLTSFSEGTSAQYQSVRNIKLVGHDNPVTTADEVSTANHSIIRRELAAKGSSIDVISLHGWKTNGENLAVLQKIKNTFTTSTRPIIFGELGYERDNNPGLDNSFYTAKGTVQLVNNGAHAIARWGYNNFGPLDATTSNGLKINPNYFNLVKIFSKTIPLTSTNRAVFKTTVNVSLVGTDTLDAASIAYKNTNGQKGVAIWIVNELGRTMDLYIKNYPLSSTTLNRFQINVGSGNNNITAGSCSLSKVTGTTSDYTISSLTLPAKTITVLTSYPNSMDMR